MDDTGHSCLAETGGAPTWNHNDDSDVGLDFAQSAVAPYLNQGYFLLDEASKRLVKPGEMSNKSNYMLMPPVVGG